MKFEGDCLMKLCFKKHTSDSYFSKCFSQYERIIFMDNEVTGFDATKDVIIRFEYVLLENGMLREPVSFLLKLPDGFIFQKEIAEFVGISNDDLSNYGKEREQAENAIIDSLFQPNTLICASHVEFDMKFIFEILYKHNQTELFHLCDYLDSYTIMRDKIGRRDKRLSALLKRFRIKPHQAESMNIYHLFERISKKYKDCPTYINKIGDRNGTKEIKDIIRA